MKNIYEVSLLDLAPKSKLQTKEDILFYKVVDKAIKKLLVEEIKTLILMDDIDNLKEEIVDLLAEELHVDFYEVDSTLEEKRNLVKSSILSHMLKGTKLAVQNILNIFFQEANIKEWFEYEGEPGTFNVDISDGKVDYTQAKKIKRMIDSVKRTSQHLNNLSFIKGDSGELYYYGVIHSSERKIDRYNPI